MGGLTTQRVVTERLDTHCWVAGPEDGTPLLLVHGNLVTGGWWRYVAEHLPDDLRIIAPDLRGFGRTQTLPVDATRGLGDMVDDVRSLLDALGLSGSSSVHAAGWSMGGGVLQQYLTTYPDDLASVTLVAPISPYGFGATRGADGVPTSDDFAGSGGGTAAPDFVERLRSGNRADDDPQGSVPAVMRGFFGARGNTAVNEDFLIDEVMLTAVGDDNYPGDSVASANWPMVGPGDRGVLNAMAPKHFRITGLADLERKPPITWVRAAEDQVIADGSFFDLATLGQVGAVPGWPGEDVAPPQPMAAQTRAVLTAYAEAGGRFEEIVLDGVAHGAPVEAPDQVAQAILQTVRVG